MVTEWQKNRAAALEAATPFLEQIYGKLEGNLAIVTKDERDELSSERWFAVDQIESVQQYCSARWDEDVYFSVSVFPTESRVSNTGSQTRVVYVDADTCDPANFRLPPSIEVQTSPGKWHCLWLLDRPTLGTLAAELSAKVSLAHSGEGADKHARDTKILRVPGTTNTKYAEPYTVTASYRDAVYSFENFAATYSDIDLTPPLPAVFGSDFKSEVYTVEQLASLQRYADAVWDRALSELNNEAAKEWGGEGWDNVSFRVACTLIRVVNAPWAHKTFNDAVALMNGSELNDPSFQASDKLLRAERDLNGESLRLPDWAEPYQRLTPPTPSEEVREVLEERIDRAGFTQWYVSVPQNGETERFLLDLISKAQTAGFIEEEVYATVTWSQVWGKAKGSTFTNEGLWLYLTNKDDDLEAVASAIPLPLAGRLKTPPLLSELERQWCRSNPSFPDTYTDWVASTGTDSATVYQRTCAYQILSGVYGDIGFLRDEFGDSRLSLYAMALGDSTTTRKTTAKDRMIAVIRGYEDRSGRIINLTSNATTEALLRALSQANNETRLMWTDEVQSFLDEVGTKKYLTGFLGTLAKVYDGTVDASLRVGQNNGNASAVVTFNFLGIGIREQVAKVLTTENYESGLLPRFVWAVADPPPFTPDAFALTPKRVERSGGFDEYPEIGPMCNHFITTRRKLGEGQPEPVYLTVEAITRMNEMNAVVCDYLRDTQQERYLSAAWGRLFASIRKAAALLALHDGVRDVTLHHALHAIHQGEFWLRDMVRMANEVAASDFDRQVDEMEKYILEAKNHQRTQADLRNKFRGLKYQDYKELLMNLVQRGRVKYDNHAETITAFMI